MENFNVIFKILTALEEAMDEVEVDRNTISYQTLGITRNRWVNILDMMQKGGYIEGISIQREVTPPSIQYRGIKITVQGLTYLKMDPMMQNIAEEKITPNIR